MLSKITKSLVVCGLFWGGSCFASTTTPTLFKNIQSTSFLFHEKKTIDYEVLYFFNLNCSTCIRFEQFIKPWWKKHYKNVSIHEIPSPVKPVWQLADNTYFATKILNPSLTFWNIMDRQSKNRKSIYDFDTANSFIQQFSTHNPDDVTIKLFSSKVFWLTDFSKKLYDKFGIDGTPTLILIAKNKNAYEVSPEFTNSFPKMLAILDALISFNSEDKTRQ